MSAELRQKLLMLRELTERCMLTDRSAEHQLTGIIGSELARSVDLAEVGPQPGSPMSLASEAGAAAPALPAVSAPAATR